MGPTFWPGRSYSRTFFQTDTLEIKILFKMRDTGKPLEIIKYRMYMEDANLTYVQSACQVTNDTVN